VVSVFSASCPMVCPMTFEAVRQVEATLSAGERRRFGVLLATIDPQRDTRETLQGLAEARRANRPGWWVTRTTPSDTRALAAALGIQYRAMENGEFSHSTVLVLLDAQGRIVARTEQISSADPEFVRQVRAALALHAAPAGTRQ